MPFCFRAAISSLAPGMMGKFLQISSAFESGIPFKNFTLAVRLSKKSSSPFIERFVMLATSSLALLAAARISIVSPSIIVESKSKTQSFIKL